MLQCYLKKLILLFSIYMFLDIEKTMEMRKSQCRNTLFKLSEVFPCYIAMYHIHSVIHVERLSAHYLCMYMYVPVADYWFYWNFEVRPYMYRVDYEWWYKVQSSIGFVAKEKTQGVRAWQINWKRKSAVAFNVFSQAQCRTTWRKCIHVHVDGPWRGVLICRRHLICFGKAMLHVQCDKTLLKLTKSTCSIRTTRDWVLIKQDQRSS